MRGPAPAPAQGLFRQKREPRYDMLCKSYRGSLLSGRPLMRSYSGLVCIRLCRVVLGICRKPALFHAFMLMEKLNDAPQAGETDYPEDRGRNHIPHKSGDPQKDQPRREKHRPYPVRKAVLAFNDDGVENTDAQKRSKPQQDPLKMNLHQSLSLPSAREKTRKANNSHSQCCLS